MQELEEAIQQQRMDFWRQKKGYRLRWNEHEDILNDMAFVKKYL